jgi:GxxExxY protein
MRVAPRRADLVHPELSYRILGVLFEVWKQIGFGHKEKFYQKAVTRELKHSKISFQEQLPAKINYKGEFLGIYYFDYLIENKIVLELKVRNYFSRKDIQQVYAYLKAKKLQLGIVAHFTASGVKFKRVVNINEK